jgi:uncharacterized protein YdeI (YjbR/CyaY-like superfamily)
MAAELPELIVDDAAAWRDWLETNHAGSAGVWLVLAKKGTSVPTSVTYDEALDEALCFGWIDGQVGRRDEATYRQRFTPRRTGSRWSKYNVERVGRLGAAGKMAPAGDAAVVAAKVDGHWEAAYASQSQIEVPDDLAAALEASPAAKATFDTLTKVNRYSILYRITSAKRPETRARNIERYVAMLARGDTPHPQARRPPR